MPKLSTTDTPERCGWLTDDPVYIKYHDEEWGRPIHDSLKLFEMLCLEGQQAGLSWKTILDKRENYRRAYHNFDPEKISQMSENDVTKLLQNAGIVRHKAKIHSIINNAKAYLTMTDEGQDFAEFIWSFVDNKTVVNNWMCDSEVPTETECSVSIAKALKKRGFGFVGSKICYAFMQACGLVNDHVIGCCARGVSN